MDRARQRVQPIDEAAGAHKRQPFGAAEPHACSIELHFVSNFKILDRFFQPVCSAA
jgi:hypothetical protein